MAYASCSHAGSSSSEDKDQSLTTQGMATRYLAIGMTFSIQTIGVLGNFSLLYHNLFIYFTGYRLRPTDLIVNNLLVANILVLFSSGIHFTMIYFGWYHHVSDLGCRFFPYLRGVGRGVSIGTTCLLSVFQAIIISPTNSRLAGLKRKAPKYIVPLILLWWILQMLVNVIIPLFMSGNLSNKNITKRKSWGFCSSLYGDKTTDPLYILLLTSPDVVCFVLMVWASGSMVFILHRHKQRVQHIHISPISSRSSPESRATKNILLLVSTFVFLNTLPSIFLITVGIFNNTSLFFPDINVLIVLCFPTFIPFLIMTQDSTVSSFSFAWIRNVKSPNLMRHM
ncbi:vomeronasal type-1 receptor 4-like [Artibeus jamaicensis]|uniref:vomeronasal type-1 receptor 4-like n=1 Tax=Artibeus jamaicensis TaxID=9417 RepID=UPI00235AE9B5|nr:vomeronasal type-1 receptor 4-like [Artibeus jamaicensis]